MNAPALPNRNGGAIGQKSRSGCGLQSWGKCGAVQRGDIARQLVGCGLPDVPGRMFYLVFHGAAISLAGIPPIMLGNERFLGIGLEGLGLAVGL